MKTFRTIILTVFGLLMLIPVLYLLVGSLMGKGELKELLAPVLGQTTVSYTHLDVYKRQALSWLKNHPGEIDLLFLDVEMPGMSGMETARRIRVFSRELLLVFVTGYSDYVFDGYQVGAMDYLIKPVDQRRLESLLHRAQEILGVQEDRMFSFRNAEGMFRMPIKRCV